MGARDGGSELLLQDGMSHGDMNRGHDDTLDDLAPVIFPRRVFFLEY